MSKMTIYTLAKELNMTPSMVSRALSPDGKVSEEKRRLVLEAAEKYNFHPNKFASRLSMKPIRIGVLMCSRFAVNAEKMTEGIRLSHEQLKDYKIDYDISIIDQNAAESEIRVILDRYAEFDGIIISGMSAARFTDIISDTYKKNKNIVQVQAVNTSAPSLFSSKHDETTASGIAADFLSQCLRYSERKNVILFTGDLGSSVHTNAHNAFKSFCAEKRLQLLSTVDMRDDEQYFSCILPEIFEKYKNQIDGIYITSGLSAPLCRYIEKNNIDIPLVAFDTYPEIKSYMEKGIISAAISQNVTHQMKIAFDALVKYIITNEKCDPILFTDVNLMLKSNMNQFD